MRLTARNVQTVTNVLVTAGCTTIMIDTMTMRTSRRNGSKRSTRHIIVKPTKSAFKFKKDVMDGRIAPMVKMRRTVLVSLLLVFRISLGQLISWPRVERLIDFGPSFL
jgi:hypothetical protein